MIALKDNSSKAPIVTAPSPKAVACKHTFALYVLLHIGGHAQITPLKFVLVLEVGD